MMIKKYILTALKRWDGVPVVNVTLDTGGYVSDEQRWVKVEDIQLLQDAVDYYRKQYNVKCAKCRRNENAND